MPAVDGCATIGPLGCCWEQMYRMRLLAAPAVLVVPSIVCVETSTDCPDAIVTFAVLLRNPRNPRQKVADRAATFISKASGAARSQRSREEVVLEQPAAHVP